LPPQPSATPPAETAVRLGSPGLPSDVVTSTRTVSQPSIEKQPAEVKDAWREIIETVVFVVVLVFMLKTFLAEAFVIPTGSMASTLLGDHKDVRCEQCGYEYRVNASQWTQPQDGRPVPLDTSDCPNCGFCNNLVRGGRP
jgi:NAD-dependent dihydropyrimidine dehydrogenase PreA subunit